MISSGRIRSRRRDREPSVRRHIIIGILGCMLLMLVFGGVWYITRLPSVSIQEITVEGGETINHALITAQVKAVLDEDYLNIIPHRFFITYPHNDVAAALLRNDRIETVNVTRNGRNNLAVSFTEYAPFALWCASLDEPTSCFFLDKHGYAFGESPLLQGGALVRHVIEDQTELSEKQVFDPTRFESMHTFLDSLASELQLRVTDVFYTKENDIILRINGGGKILMHNEGNLSHSLENLKTVLHSDSFKHLKPGNFQYIDIRFGNKVFVNEEPEIKASSTTPPETAATST